MLVKVSLRSKIIGGFFIVAMITMLVGVIGWHGVKTISEDMKQINVNDLSSVEALLTISQATTEIDSAENFILVPEATQGQLQDQFDRIAAADKRGTAARQAYNLLAHTKQEAILLDAYSAAVEKWKSEDRHYISLAKQYQVNKTPELRNEMIRVALVTQNENFSAVDKALKDLVKYKNDQVDENTKANEKSAGFYIMSALVVAIIGFIIALFIGTFLGITMTRPLQAAANSIRESSQQVAAASEQLSGSSQQLAESNAEQAAAIEETSSTLEEASSMLKQSSDNARQALQLSNMAKLAADKGNAEMKEMIVSIDEIKASSDQIAKIIKVIDEIAFQTNILALNAAVEAARAGDVGMGFAVVAEEVRNLAQRSAQAAKDTEAIIENNIMLSAKGVDVSRQVAETFSEITLKSQKVNELVDEISAASVEQTQGVSQIHKAMMQMEQATQQNAATAEESAAASEQLSAQAQTVNQVVNDIVALIHGGGSQHIDNPQNKRAVTKVKSTALKKVNAISLKENNQSSKAAGQINPNDVIPLDKDQDGF